MICNPNGTQRMFTREMVQTEGERLGQPRTPATAQDVTAVGVFGAVSCRNLGLVASSYGVPEAIAAMVDAPGLLWVRICQRLTGPGGPV